MALAVVALALATIAFQSIEKRQDDFITRRNFAATTLARASHAVLKAPYAILSILAYDDNTEAGRQAPVLFLDAVRETRNALNQAVELVPDKATEIEGFRKRFEDLIEKAKTPLAMGNAAPGLTRGAALTPAELAQIASAAVMAAETDVQLQSLARDLAEFEQALTRENARMAPVLQGESDVAILILAAVGFGTLFLARMSGRRRLLYELLRRREARRQVRAIDWIEADYARAPETEASGAETHRHPSLSASAN